jgi:hypothetical protein
MPQIVDQLRSPYGLSNGTILSGSVTTTADAFWYNAVTATTAIINFSNLALGAASTGSISASFVAGQSIYGAITSVSQSSGIGILYSGSYLPGTSGR